jgi:hypothetical protein
MLPDTMDGSAHLPAAPSAITKRTRTRTTLTGSSKFMRRAAEGFYVARGMKPGTPVSTTLLNLTFTVISSRISRMASSGNVDI